MTLVFSEGTTVQTYWYHLDGRGNIAGLTKHLGQSTYNYRYDAYGQVLPAHGNWTDPHNHYTFLGKEWDDHLGLYEFGARLYDPWAGVWITREPLPGDAWRPRTWHRYAYAFASPVSYYDAYGLQACEDSSDPECQAKALELKNKALELKEAVRQGEIEPVEAFAQLLDYADTLFNEDPQGVMWGVTNVLLGVDPNKDEVWQVGLGKIDQDANPFYVGQKWLPCCQGQTERGDWKPIYWDKTPNQAYHFWYYAAVRYYHGPIMGTLLAHYWPMLGTSFMIPSGWNRSSGRTCTS